MQHSSMVGSSWGASWRKSLGEALRTVSAFLNLSGKTAGRSLEDEVRELVRPSLPVLMHKRAKLLGDTAEGYSPAQRWLAELDRYVDRILWPMLSPQAGYSQRRRRRVAAWVDAQVAAGQEASAAHDPNAAPPVTWRTDTGWAG